MAKRSKFDIRYSGPIIAVAAAFLIALMWIRPDLNKFEPAPEIITQQQMMCKSYENSRTVRPHGRRKRLSGCLFTALSWLRLCNAPCVVEVAKICCIACGGRGQVGPRLTH